MVVYYYYALIRAKVKTSAGVFFDDDKDIDADGAVVVAVALDVVHYVQVQRYNCFLRRVYDQLGYDDY